jgi:hypothetical protein
LAFGLGRDRESEKGRRSNPLVLPRIWPESEDDSVLGDHGAGKRKTLGEEDGVGKGFDAEKGPR